MYNLEEHTGQDSGVHQKAPLNRLTRTPIPKSGGYPSFVEELGFNVEIIEPARLNEVFSGIDIMEVCLGIPDAATGFADRDLVTNGVTNTARELGVTNHTQPPVQDIETTGTAVSAIETQRGRDPSRSS